jgi:site-specific recombinase XerD
MRERIEQFQMFLAAERGLSTSYQLSVLQSLEHLAKWMESQSLTLEDISLVRLVDFMDFLADGSRKRSTRRVEMVHVRIFFRWLHMRHFLPTDPAALLDSAQPEIQLPETLDEETVRILLESISPDNLPLGARDRAVIALMLGCGLRRGEIPGLQLERLDLMNRTLTLIGKGDKERRVFLPPPVAQVVETWVRRWRGTNPGLLFGRIFKNGRISVEDPLDPSSVGRITKRRMEAANHESATAHDLRRTFATRLFANNVDIVTVKNMMGHSNIATTAMYDRRGDDAMRRAAENAVL